MNISVSGGTPPYSYGVVGDVVHPSNIIEVSIGSHNVQVQDAEGVFVDLLVRFPFVW